MEARIEGGLSGCTPLDVDFLNLSDGAVTYEWNFGDGGQSATMHTNHTFTALPGEDAQYTVTLTATSVHGCTDTAEVSVQVFAQPDASFVSSGTQLTYPDAEVVFSNTSTAGESAAYYWTFGDRQVSYAQNPGTHTFNSWGTYDITLEVDNGDVRRCGHFCGTNLGPCPHHWLHRGRHWLCSADRCIPKRKQLRQQLPLGIFRRFGAQR